MRENVAARILGETSFLSTHEQLNGSVDLVTRRESSEISAVLNNSILSRPSSVELGWKHFAIETAALRPFTACEVAPGPLSVKELEQSFRDGLCTHWHQSGTAKMGRDAMSVVDSKLKVYGVEGLRIADASILPRVTTGNTMAPCVVIRERAADALRSDYKLEIASALSTESRLNEQDSAYPTEITAIPADIL